MTILTWNDSFSVGIADIDDQHKELIAMIQSLHEAMVARHGKEALQSIADRMIEYAAFHFGTEEAFMRQHSYPGIDEHAREHQQFVAKCLDIQSRLRSGSLVLSIEVMDFLREWLRDHILNTDKTLGAFLSGRGVS